MPGYQFQTGVMWDGALVFGPLGFRWLKVMQQEIAPLGNHYLHVSFGYGEPMRLVDRKGTNSPSIRRGLEGGRLPIPHVETRDGDLGVDAKPSLPISWAGPPRSGSTRSRTTRW